MEDFVYYIILLTIGGLSGCIIGLTGASGMSAMIAGLLLLGIDIKTIIPLTFVITLVNSFSALPKYISHKNIRIKEGLFIAIPSAIFVFLGNFIGSGIKSSYLTIAIIICLFSIGLKLTFFDKDKKVVKKVKTKLNHPLSFIALGAILGVIMGVLGSGGGLFINILLLLLFKFSIKEAIGTSILVMGVSALSGTFINVMNNAIDYKMVLLISISSVICAIISSHFANKAKEKTIKKTLGIYLLVISTIIAIKGVLW